LELLNLGQNSRTDWSCSGNWWSQKVRPKFSLRQCSCVFYPPNASLTGVIARIFMGPKDARIGEPREKERTAAFARNAPTKVLVIACLFDLADLDKVDKPVLRSPARKDFIAEPAFVCSRSAKAAPVSITFIPKLREVFLLARVRLRTMPLLGELAT